MKKYVICVNSDYTRDGQIFNTQDIPDEDLGRIDIWDPDYENNWKDLTIHQFIGIFEAESGKEACHIAAEKQGINAQILYAIEV